MMLLMLLPLFIRRSFVQCSDYIYFRRSKSKLTAWDTMCVVYSAHTVLTFYSFKRFLFVWPIRICLSRFCHLLWQCQRNMASTHNYKHIYSNKTAVTNEQMHDKRIKTEDDEKKRRGTRRDEESSQAMSENMCMNKHRYIAIVPRCMPPRCNICNHFRRVECVYVR